MSNSEIHLEDVGIRIIATIKNEDDEIVDISSATTKQFIFNKPDGSSVTKSASLYSDGTDGKMYYATEDGFLDQIGYWEVQGYVVVGASEWHTNITKIKIHRNNT